MSAVSIFKKNPLFLLLLPAFYVLHGCRINFPLVSTRDGFMLAGIYIIWSLVFMAIFRLFFRNWIKAAIASFALMAFHLFFGSIQDGLRSAFPGLWITRYSFILPTFFLLFVWMIIVLKKRSRSLSTLTSYLNALFLLLLLIDAAWLAVKVAEAEKKQTRDNKQAVCADCKKPNIYLILLDEYAGHKELKDLFAFDNSAFENELLKRGFHVTANTKSNYNFTPFSMASLLNMDYLQGISSKSNDIENRTICYRTINKNNLVSTLKNQGYIFSNESIFDFAGESTRLDYGTLHLNGKRIITSQTLTGRIGKELSFHLLSTFKMGWALKNYGDEGRKNIQAQFDNTLRLAGERPGKPRFTYTHFFMPHYPYVYDQAGNAISYDESMMTGRKDLYIGYLQYANKLSLSLIDGILQKDKTDPIILLMSDHGFNKYDASAGPGYVFNNIINIRMPGQDYSGFPDSLSNVNVFRLLLNKQFNYQLPLLRDSTILLQEY